MAEKAKYGDVYNQDSMRTNSVTSYLLISPEEAGYPVNKIETFKGDKLVEDPNGPDRSSIFGMNFDQNQNRRNASMGIGV